MNSVSQSDALTTVSKGSVAGNGRADKSAAGERKGPPSAKVRKPYVITKQRERWTPEEHDRFLKALQLYGRQWRKIEEYIGTKTAVQIRSHAQKFFTKLEKEGGKQKGDITNGMNIVIPPPRPKRKPSHPYPRKAKTSAADKAKGENGAAAGVPHRAGSPKSPPSYEDLVLSVQKALAGASPDCGAQPVGDQLTNLANNLLVWNAAQMMQPGSLPLGLPGGAAFPGMLYGGNGVVAPTPHKINPGLLTFNGNNYGIAELQHMHRILLNAASNPVGSEEKKKKVLQAAEEVMGHIQKRPGGPSGTTQTSTSGSAASLAHLTRISSMPDLSAFTSTQATQTWPNGSGRTGESGGREVDDSYTLNDGGSGSGSQDEAQLGFVDPAAKPGKHRTARVEAGAANGDSNGSNGNRNGSNGYSSGVGTHFDEGKNGQRDGWNDNDLHQHCSSGSDQSNEQANNATSKDHAESIGPGQPASVSGQSASVSQEQWALLCHQALQMCQQQQSNVLWDPNVLAQMQRSFLATMAKAAPQGTGAEPVVKAHASVEAGGVAQPQVAKAAAQAAGDGQGLSAKNEMTGFVKYNQKQ